MSSASRDLIQISLGSSSNAVTAHTLNLHGLSGTDEECEASVTHRVERNYWVPRCLMVDEPARFFAAPEISQALDLSSSAAPGAALACLNPDVVLESAFAIQSMDPALSLGHAQQNPWSRDYQSMTSKLAHSSFSRYYQIPSQNKGHASSYQASLNNPRHVNWEEEEEDEEEDSETEDQRHAREERERAKWQRETVEPLQSELERSVKESLPPEDLTWMDFWMPPYSSQSKIALEYSHQSTLAPHWDAYKIGAREWMEDTLFEGLRHLLEESDSCQGCLVTTEGHGYYSGMATALLQEIQQETKSAGRIVFHVTNPKTQLDEDIDRSSWQPAHVERVRRQLSNGLALHDLTQNSHAVVPLKLDESISLFEASAQIAMALEACTLPIRITAKAPRRIGLTNVPFVGNGGEYDMQWGSTAQCLSMGEYLQGLLPSNQYKLMELTSLLSSASVSQDLLWHSIMKGTSLERDARTRDAGNSRCRPRDVPPGEWFQDSKLDNREGLLSSLSPCPRSDRRFFDRSLHHHFALATALRPTTLESNSDPRYQYDPTSKTLNHYQTAIVQGMGVGYRPERSVVTVGNQTLGQLTFANTSSGGAGAYWRTLLPSAEQPTLAVLSNSTRSYGYLEQVSAEMKMVLGARYRGYHQRDIANDVLPEAEDCTEALEGCFDLRDMYQPPEGSALVNSDDDNFDY